MLEGQFYADVFALRSLDTYLQFKELIQNEFKSMGNDYVDVEGWLKCPEDNDLMLFADDKLDLNDVDLAIKRINVVKHLTICLRCQLLWLWKEWRGKTSFEEFSELISKLRNEGYLNSKIDDRG